MSHKKPDVLFDAAKHTYTVEGKKVPSVTSILGIKAKPALIPWAVNETIGALRPYLGSVLSEDLLMLAKGAHLRRKQDAADIGTAVHDWITKHLTEGDKTLPERTEVLRGVKGFLDWRDAHSVKILASELVVYSPTYGFAGTLDAEVEIDGGRCILDFKTSKQEYASEWSLQLAAYRLAREDAGCDPYTIPDRVVRFDKETGEFEVFSYPDPDLQHRAAFLAALILWRHEHGK